MIGTAAYTDVDFLDQAVAELGDRVVVSIDARAGKLAGAGWTEQTDIPIEAVIEQLARAACSGSFTRASTATACSRVPTSMAPVASPTPSAARTPTREASRRWTTCERWSSFGRSICAR